MPSISATIFDLDGVLVDTARFHFLAWRELAHSLNITFEENENEALKGVDRMTSLEIILQLGNREATLAQKLRWAEEKNQRFLFYVSNMTPEDILPGVLPFLNHLKENNIQMAVASSSKNALTILEKIGLTSFFSKIVDGNQVQRTKPDPEIFLKAADHFGRHPNECVVFEDAKAGIEAALAGGMWAVGIGKKDDLPKAHWTINNFSDITIETVVSHLD